MKLLLLTLFALLFSFSSQSQPGDNSLSVSKPIFIPAEKTIFHKLGNRNIALKIMQYGDVKNIVCINLHDNEDASVQAARSLLEIKGGTLIKIENNGQRVIRFKLNGLTYGFDPNRIYSRIGILQTLRDNKRTSRQAVDEIEKFARHLLSLITDSSSCIIALHNNTEGFFSIKSYIPGGNRQQDARAVYENSLQDIDDIAFTTDSLLYQKMSDSGYNTIWQDNERAKKDGSFSIYCGEKNRRYINIETQHGKVNQYIEMLEKLLHILEEENKKSPSHSGEDFQ